MSDASDLLRSPVGIYWLCFCRQKLDSPCADPSEFLATVGLLTARGPFRQDDNACEVGSVCMLELSGIGLHARDFVVLTHDDGCDNISRVYNDLQMQQPLPTLQDGTGLRAYLGSIPFNATPGKLQICHCPAGFLCDTFPSFRAAAGTLEITCPRGRFYSNGACALCGRGFYCAGGTVEDATRIRCRQGETTLVQNGTNFGDCECAPGHFHDSSSSSCLPCSKGTYKPLAGNDACTRCMSNFTHLQGSVSESACTEPIFDPIYDLRAESKVPTVSFHFLVSTATQLGFGKEDNSQMTGMLRHSIMDSTRMLEDAVTVTLSWGESGGRHLSAYLRAAVMLKFRSHELASMMAEDLDLNIVLDDVKNAVWDSRNLHIELLEVSELLVSSTLVTCPANAVVPPGVIVLQAEECQCQLGFGWNRDSQACLPCPLSFYKPKFGNVDCVRCQPYRSTLQTGAVTSQDCVCQSGLFDESGGCRSCPQGSYCPGSGAATPCPANSTTNAIGSRSIDDCICSSGYQRPDPGQPCEPCPASFFKSAPGDGLCPQKCPANAKSKVGSTSDAACNCMPGFHAILDDGHTLLRCADCSAYEGLTCSGGFQQGNHSQPEADPGFYRTGATSGVPCVVEIDENQSVCLGSNECALGSSGMLCGECPEGWARGSYPEPCASCESLIGQTSIWLMLVILTDLARIAVLNFGVAVISAAAAGTVSLKLHSPMIRILLRWKDACSVLTGIALDRLPAFAWSQKTEHLGGACSGANCSSACLVLISVYFGLCEGM